MAAAANRLRYCSRELLCVSMYVETASREPEPGCCIIQSTPLAQGTVNGDQRRSVRHGHIRLGNALPVADGNPPAIPQALNSGRTPPIVLWLRPRLPPSIVFTKVLTGRELACMSARPLLPLEIGVLLLSISSLVRTSFGKIAVRRRHHLRDHARSAGC